MGVSSMVPLMRDSDSQNGGRSLSSNVAGKGSCHSGLDRQPELLEQPEATGHYLGVVLLFRTYTQCKECRVL